MRAHPMITPLAAVTPEQIAAQYPEDAATVYRVIWENTLAHIKPPPHICTERQVYAAGTQFVAVDWAVPVTPGWLELVSSEFVGPMALRLSGAADIPADVPMERCTFRVEGHRRGENSLTVDAILGWLDTLSVASPGKIAELIEECQDAGWVIVENGSVWLTEDGSDQVELADGAGCSKVSGVNTARWRLLTDEYLSNELSLAELLAESCRLWGIDPPLSVATLEEAVQEGHSAEDSYALREKHMIARIATADYPPGVDPERLLPKEDPWRVRRAQLEGGLSAGAEHNWCSLSTCERAAIRLGAVAAAMNANDARRLADDIHFDVRWRWLVGLGPTDPAPSLDDAARAFSSWSGARPRGETR